ncbi:uncharacterized protein LOC131851662 [Achroia grisella]|uniref:uncharacterized protein LOC131851662 n=1 Tax=Achroia grisella TaxID=688607 RepID=UPI0027D1F7DA|nr:uncharacterized protein LOC131851662 [Achroia grisella]
MKLKKLKSDTEESVPAVPPQAEIIEADLYKRSYFGPDVPTLELECWEEELSEVQLKAYKNADDEYKSIQSKLDEMVKDTGGEIVYNGDQFTAYQLLGKQPVLKDLERQSAEIIRSRSRSLSVAKEKPTSKRGRPRKVREEDRNYSPSPERTKSPETRHKKKKKDKNREKDKERDKERDKDKDKDKDSTKTKDKTLAPSNVHSVVTNVRPSEATAIGGLLTGSATKTTTIVDLTKEESNKNVADSREVSFNKLQGKTFPSLVVVARPYLRSKETAPPSDRSALDSKVKSVLMHTPMKFTEWLIQQGLVRSEQWCIIHPGNKLKLGMYSDVTKFPYSGGYVWISECCPTRFVSVFSSSIFEGATFPPSVLLKLIYHWACQTNVQNVVQWVKVDNLYVKGLFTWLRAICTSAIHQHLSMLGGPGKKVEVGVISLGTTSHDGTQRQVKVEVLGVLDPVEKLIRLRAVEPLAEHEKNYKKRFQKILEPLSLWVHPSSVILTDLTVDKSTLVCMGFKTVHQASSHSDQPSRNSNANIMEYLRRIVPRMFQNTLSLLSRQIIQQFLDELVWREKYGISPGQAFDNIVLHISEQTKLEAKDAITVRLNKIAANPFKNWKYPSKKNKDKVEEPEPELGRSKRGRRKKDPSPLPPPKKKKKEKAPPATATTYIDDDDEEEVPLALRRTKIKQELEKPKEKEKTKEKETENLPTRRRKVPKTYVDDDGDLDDIPLKNIKKEIKPEETVSMERYYFGQIVDNEPVEKVAIAVECPICHVEITDNLKLMEHIFTHVAPAPDGGDGVYCNYCVTSFANEDDLQAHLKEYHPADTKSPGIFTYACLICEVRFAAVLTLAAHMQKVHAPLELPYCCGACRYRASGHRAAADHFRAAHASTARVFCPHCLKVIIVYSDGCELTSNILLYIDHLKQHEEKIDIRCSRCVLKFVHLGQLKEHQVRDHHTVEDAAPLCSGEHLINKPKNKARPPVKDSTSHTISETYEEMTLVLPEGMICRECDTSLERDKHFLGTSHCTKCPYASSCYRAMLRHSCYCAGPHSLEDAPRRAYRTHCVCGYQTDVGTDMLTHLLMCAHKTAYSSEEEARANTVGAAEPASPPPAAPHPAPHPAPTPDDEPADTAVESVPAIADYAPPSVLNTQLSLDDLAPPSVLQPDQHDQELLKDEYDRPLATPRHEDPHYSLGDFEPLPQEPPPQPDFEQL